MNYVALRIGVICYLFDLLAFKVCFFKDYLYVCNYDVSIYSSFCESFDLNDYSCEVEIPKWRPHSMETGNEK